MIMMMRKRKDDEDSGEIDKLSSVGSELIVSEILLATARKCTAENDHDDEVKYKSWSKNMSTFFWSNTLFSICKNRQPHLILQPLFALVHCFLLKRKATSGVLKRLLS